MNQTTRILLYLSAWESRYNVPSLAFGQVKKSPKMLSIGRRPSHQRIATELAKRSATSLRASAVVSALSLTKVQIAESNQKPIEPLIQSNTKIHVRKSELYRET
jgi:hypothetical protein